MRNFWSVILVFGLVSLGCSQNGEQQSKSEDAEGMAESASQTQQMMAPDDSVSAEWQIRLDYPSRGSKDDITVETTSKGYHIVSGPRAIYYKSGMNASGEYRLSATFTQNNQPGPEAYGLIIGGENLQANNQHYLYFLIRQTGDYLIKRRVGDETQSIAGWSGHKSIQSVQDSEQPENTLSINVTTDNVQFMVNGESVNELSKDEVKFTEGQTGLRVNHRLDLTVEDIQLSQSDG